MPWGAAYHEGVAARWRSSYVVKLGVWWVGYLGLVRLLPGSHSGWAVAAIFFGAVIVTTIVMTLVSDGRHAFARIVRPSAWGSEQH